MNPHPLPFYDHQDNIKTDVHALRLAFHHLVRIPTIWGVGNVFPGLPFFERMKHRKVRSEEPT